MKKLADGFQFECSGRTFYAHCGIVGLAPDFRVSGGYDQPIYEFDDTWTREECLELCTYMANLWTALGAKVDQRSGAKFNDPAVPRSEFFRAAAALDASRQSDAKWRRPEKLGQIGLT